MTQTTERLTIYIVDDDASVRDSLSLVLSLRGYTTALFVSAEDFLRTYGRDWHGCVITDLKMPGLSGLELQEELANRGAELPVVVITAHGDVAAARAAFKTQAIDFLEKPFSDDQLIAAVETAFTRERARLAAQAEKAKREAALAALSGREREVMELLVRGMHNKEIGEQLRISARTVEVHKARVMAKLGIRNVIELIRITSPPS